MARGMETARDRAYASDHYLESELHVSVGSSEVVEACYEVAASLDMTVLETPRGRLVLAGYFPEFARIDVEVTKKEEGSLILLDLGSARWSFPLRLVAVTCHTSAASSARSASNWTIALCENKRPGPPASGDMTEATSIRPASGSIRSLRFAAVVCGLGGLFVLAGGAFMWFPTRFADFEFVLVGVWLVLVSYCLEGVRRRLLGLASRGTEILIGASSVVWAVVTSIHYLLR